MHSAPRPAWDVIVVGAGAAGLVAAERAATRGRRTLLLEKNRRLGVKILMSGGTRCNLTHATDRRGIVAAYGPPGRFLYSALAALGPAELVALVEGEGVATKKEATGKIFPVSDRATDVLAVFVSRLQRSGCELACGEPVSRIGRHSAGFLVVTCDRELTCRSLILACGGQSYPAAGTTGDGYAWARDLGHTVVPPRPALVPLVSPAAWVTALRGVTVPDVAIRISETPPSGVSASTAAALASARGPLLFTHFGLSGPAVMDVSRTVSAHENPQRLAVECDFVPDKRLEDLDDALCRWAAEEGRRQLWRVLADILPKRLGESLIERANLRPDTRAAELTRHGRQRLAAALKRTVIPLAGTRGFSSAEVTAGGVSLDEIDSRTMQSKLVPELFVAGELLDLDGPIGGYNFQAAFSTGWLAGLSV